jgi:hypothetical protein
LRPGIPTVTRIVPVAMLTIIAAIRVLLGLENQKRCLSLTLNIKNMAEKNRTSKVNVYKAGSFKETLKKFIAMYKRPNDSAMTRNPSTSDDFTVPVMLHVSGFFDQHKLSVDKAIFTKSVKKKYKMMANAETT